MLNATIWTYATCLVEKVCGPLWSTWGAPMGEGKSRIKAGIVNGKVGRAPGKHPSRRWYLVGSEALPFPLIGSG